MILFCLNFLRLLRGIFSSQQRLNRPAVNAVQRRSGSDAMEFLTERAKMNYELKQQEFKMLQEQQALERSKNGSNGQRAATNTTATNRNV